MLILLIILVLFTTSCSSIKSLNYEGKTYKSKFIHDGQKKNIKKHAIVIKIPYLSSPIIKQMIETGQLPHISFLLEKGKSSFYTSTTGSTTSEKKSQDLLLGSNQIETTSANYFDRAKLQFKNINHDLESLVYQKISPTSLTFIDYLEKKNKKVNYFENDINLGNNLGKQSKKHSYSFKEEFDLFQKLIQTYENTNKIPLVNIYNFTLPSKIIQKEGLYTGEKSVLSNDHRDIYCYSNSKNNRYEPLFNIFSPSSSYIENQIILENRSLIKSKIIKGQETGHIIKTDYLQAYNRLLKFCIKTPMVKTILFSNSFQIAKYKQSLVNPNYILSLIFLDIQIGKIIHELRKIGTQCHSRKYCNSDVLPTGLPLYIEGQKKENTLFENTLFIITGTSGVTNSQKVSCDKRCTPNNKEKLIDEISNTLDLGLKNNNERTKRIEKIIVDVNNLPLELDRPYEVSDRYNQGTRKFIKKITSQIKNKNSKEKYLVKDILRTNRKYETAEHRLRKSIFNNNVRLALSVSSAHSAEIFIPTRRKNNFLWERKRPSFKEVINYSLRPGEETLVRNLLENLPSVGLIFIRKNNQSFSSYRKLPNEMEILVINKSFDKSLIKVKKDSSHQELLIGYKSLAYDDPLGRYVESVEWKTFRQWKEFYHQKDTYYYNVMAAMAHYLYSSSEAIGDMTVFHQEGFSFNLNLASSGGLEKEEQLTMSLFSGPMVRPGILKTHPFKIAKLVKGKPVVAPSPFQGEPYTIDIVPALLEWLSYSSSSFYKMQNRASSKPKRRISRVLQQTKRDLFNQDFIRNNKIIKKNLNKFFNNIQPKRKTLESGRPKGLTLDL